MSCSTGDSSDRGVYDMLFLRNTTSCEFGLINFKGGGAVWDRLCIATITQVIIGTCLMAVPQH